MTKDTRNVLIAAVALVVLLVASFAVTPGPGGDVEPGMVAPDFELPLRGADRTVRLSDYRGRVVMVNFWATWCPPCVQEFPSMQKLYEQVRGEDFEMLAISLDKLGDEVLAEFLQKGDYTIPILLDPGHSISAKYGTFRFPETFLIDRSGVVAQKFVGAVDWSAPEAVGFVRELIARAPEPAPEPEATPEAGAQGA